MDSTASGGCHYSSHQDLTRSTTRPRKELDKATRWIEKSLFKFNLVILTGALIQVAPKRTIVSSAGKMLQNV